MARKLVAYFSAGGTTEILAKRLASVIDADIFEIKPEVPYTKADIKWTNPLARCNKEKFGKKDVPIESKISDLSAYDIVFIGFPIWYYAAPNIIETFLKENDFSDMKIALFATSGGSEIGKTADKLKPFLDDGAEIVAADVFSPKVDVKTLQKWAKL